jgi:flagellar motor switch protein FliN/FliY
MSDGALSQDEIDALLAGVDSSSLGGSSMAAPAATAVASGPSDADRQALENFFASITGALASNLSTLTSATVNLKGPQTAFSSRDSFLPQLPDTVTVIKADFSSGFPGEHIFILGEDTAKAIASLMTKEDNIQLDEMAMSVIGEVVSQLVGTQITALTDKTGNKSIASASPNAANMSKATAALPSGDFAAMTYQLDLGDGGAYQMWEILGPSPAGDIAHALSGGGQAAAAMPNMGMPAMGGMDMGMNMGGMGMSAMNGMGNMQGMGAMGMGQGMVMPGMQGMGTMPGMGNMPNLGPTNVQSVQFPNLMQPRLGPQEAGNIGLIMDVSMEMTVELGRTRKLIKEILGMGEGTIIELDKLAGEPVDILVNHKLIAKGEVVVIDENFGVRVTEIVSPMERINEMG